MNNKNKKTDRSAILNYALIGFIKIGLLPVLLIVGMAYFSIVSDHFFTFQNFKNIIRQTSYLVLVSAGQMFPLLTGGFDLSVGTIVALTSVVGATVMATCYAMFPDMIFAVVLLGIAGGIIAGTCIGIINGIGVSFFDVSPFMMTLGMTSVGFGIALYMTGGTPVYGMPAEFANVFGYGEFWGIPVPVAVTVCILLVLFVIVNQTTLGRYFYAVGGNIKAARLSGINARFILFAAYLFSGAVASVTGILLTARLDTGEANIGAAMPMESIAACVIAGISLRGGVGRLESVIAGALFIGLMHNGMNLAHIESYLQTVVIGMLLIFAVAADQFRSKMINKFNS